MLRELDGTRALYSVPRDDLVGEVLLPAIKSSTGLRCMVGYFDSASFKFLAPGLATYVNRSDAGPFRLLASPRLTTSDRLALEEAVESPQQVLTNAVRQIMHEARVSASALERHHYRCLAYLVAARRLEMRLVYMPNGLFHPKVWLFDDGEDKAAAMGSSNVTVSGLVWNYEIVRVERSWKGAESSESIEEAIALFERLWSEGEPDTLVLDLPSAVRMDLLHDGEEGSPPTIEDFWAAWRQDAEAGMAPELPPSLVPPIDVVVLNKERRLRIPPGLEWISGPFRHQGDAVSAWEDAGRRGILAMATGSGKTVTALLSATRLQDDLHGPLLIVVAAPYVPLVSQWEEEVRSFGLDPVPLARLTGAQKWSRVADAFRGLRFGASSTEVLVVSHDMLCDVRFGKQLERLPESASMLLIADEVHNLGRERFISAPPERFNYRLGLSATPERQYDPVGTESLMGYFGGLIFEFSLKDAIGVCLVPYEYFVHPVDLADDEYEEYVELTERLRKAGFGQGDDADPGDSRGLGPEITKLLVKRRALIEAARSKVASLRAILQTRPRRSLRHTLIYTTAKNRSQLLSVNRMLQDDLGLLFHQLTAMETSDRAAAQRILGSFAEGHLQVLTSMKVLDEGVNIPEVTDAFILASSTVVREWVQRRGRVLRTCPAINKTKAAIHDFAVLPPDIGSSEARSILKQERARILEFAQLSLDPTDAYAVMSSTLGLA